jgi:hypothetical protein
MSDRMEINRSIVQGSGIGPFLYILNESDLHPLSQNNEIFKYADDTNLLVPQHSDTPIEAEFDNILQWTRNNKMIINVSKTKEIVFRRPRVRCTDIQPSFVDIDRVDEVKLLGVTLNSKLTFGKHVSSLLTLCNQRFYLLKVLRDQGMPLLLLRNIYHALIVNRITYCLSAWGGFLTTDSVGRLNAVFKRAKRYGFTDTVYDVIGLLENADEALFSQIQLNNNHCLYHVFYLLVDRTLVAYAHEVTISPCQNALILCTGDLISPEVYIIIFKLRFSHCPILYFYVN